MSNEADLQKDSDKKLSNAANSIQRGINTAKKIKTAVSVGQSILFSSPVWLPLLAIITVAVIVMGVVSTPSLSHVNLFFQCRNFDMEISTECREQLIKVSEEKIVNNESCGSVSNPCRN